VRSTIANRSSRRRTLSSVSSASSRRRSTAAEQDGQDRSITLSGQSLPIGYLPERCRLGCRNPVAQSRTQLADTLNAMDNAGQFNAQSS
jgi:hypothetical protein